MTDTNVIPGPDESGKGNRDGESQQSTNDNNSEPVADVTLPPPIVHGHEKVQKPGASNLRKGSSGGSNDNESSSGPTASPTNDVNDTTTSGSTPSSQQSRNALTNPGGSGGRERVPASSSHAPTIQKQTTITTSCNTARGGGGGELAGQVPLAKTKATKNECQYPEEVASSSKTLSDPNTSSLPMPAPSEESAHGMNSKPLSVPSENQGTISSSPESSQPEGITPMELGEEDDQPLISRIQVPAAFLANQISMNISRQLLYNNPRSTFPRHTSTTYTPGLRYPAQQISIPTPQMKQMQQLETNRRGQHSGYQVPTPTPIHHNYNLAPTVSGHGSTPTYPPKFTDVPEQLWNLLRTKERTFKAIFYYRSNSQPPPRPIPFSLNSGYWTSKDPSLVPMPFSSESRWERIVRELKSLQKICETERPRHPGGRVATAVKSYCKDASHYDFEILSGRDLSKHVVSTIPVIVELALSLPSLLACPIPILECGQSKTLFVSKMLCCSLLANAFFSTFPEPRSNMPDINFHRLFSTSASSAKSVVKAEKIMCLLNYFRQMGEPRYQQQFGNHLISYERRHKSQVPGWGSSKKGLIKIVVEPRKKIEEMDGMLQVDFANKVVGGGVLNDGAVMEEILFVVCPELILSRLFTETLNDKEILLITGAHQFSKYEGYAANFVFKEPFPAPKVGRDGLGRLSISVVAMDALHFKGNPKTQFRQDLIDRELQKALVGFGQDGSGLNSPIATGNWGCGAFNGDIELKFLIQWLAATEAGRTEMHFHTVGGKRQGSAIEEVVDLLKRRNVDAGKLYKLVVAFYDDRFDYDSVFQFIEDKLKNRFRKGLL